MRSKLALLFSGAAGIVLLCYHWQHLPERVASHFNATGAVDGWMGRDAHVAMAVALFVSMTAVFLGIGALILRLPPRWINLPHKDYWFAEGRERHTREDLASWSYAFGAMLNVFLIFVFHLVFLANLKAPVVMGSRIMIIGLTVYLILSLGSVILLLVRFSRAG